MSISNVKLVFVVALVSLASGCASYVTPGGPVDLTSIDSEDISALMAREPAATIPANISFVRVQSWDYHSQSASTYGYGNYSVVTTRELMQDGEIDGISDWPGVAGVAPINRLLLPEQLRTIEDLRTAGARVRSDVLLLYTIDTAFRVDGKNIGPLSVISIGTLRDRETVVTSTASALLIDVRTGFIYGVAEASASDRKYTNAWSSGSAVDQSRIITEQEAYDNLLIELRETWSGVVAEHMTSTEMTGAQ